MRLLDYDYSQPGAYFVTIVTANRECLFGEVVNGEMVPNELGVGVAACWHEIPSRFPSAEIDAFVVMPNHIHGVLVFAEQGPGGAVSAPLQRPTLGQVVAYFKYQSTKGVNDQRGTPGVRVWQRNYYEHVIRGEGELDRVGQYVQGNPGKWELDPENPACQALPARGGPRRGAVPAPSGT